MERIGGAVVGGVDSLMNSDSDSDCTALHCTALDWIRLCCGRKEGMKEGGEGIWSEGTIDGD